LKKKMTVDHILSCNINCKSPAVSGEDKSLTDLEIKGTALFKFAVSHVFMDCILSLMHVYIFYISTKVLVFDT
jgi:hypothetical protein